MTKSLKTMMDRLPVERRQKIEARAAELIAEEMTLAQLRKAMQFTQERIAETLSIGQDGVSRLEKRSDLLLSTLQSYLAAMGGKLELVAQFPNRPPVSIKGFPALSPEYEADSNQLRGRRSTAKPLAQGEAKN